MNIALIKPNLSSLSAAGDSPARLSSHNQIHLDSG
jgi:hypothetical protein